MNHDENSDGRVQQWKRDLPDHHYPSYRYTYEDAPEITVANQTIADIENIQIGGICNEKRVLFPHQIENIDWMTRLEDKIIVSGQQWYLDKSVCGSPKKRDLENNSNTDQDLSGTDISFPYYELKWKWILIFRNCFCFQKC